MARRYWIEHISHSAKGKEWKKHKYLYKEGDRYIYPDEFYKKKNQKKMGGQVAPTVNGSSGIISIGQPGLSATQAAINGEGYSGIQKKRRKK